MASKLGSGPGKTWLFNVLGVRVPEGDLQKISHPRLELAAHHTLQMMQVGAITGTAVVGPFGVLYTVAKFRDMVPSWELISRKAFRCGAFGILVGLTLGPAVSFALTRPKPLDDMMQRCYVLRHDKRQLRADRTAVAGALLGCAAARGLRQPYVPFAVFGFCMAMLGVDMYDMMRPEENYYFMKQTHS